jgi:hypothetical protein
MLSPVSGYVNKNLGFGKAGTGNSWQLLGRTATAATVGGTVTAISGGKFANGAASAAFMHLVNAEATGVVGLLRERRSKLNRNRNGNMTLYEAELYELMALEYQNTRSKHHEKSDGLLRGDFTTLAGADGFFRSSHTSQAQLGRENLGGKYPPGFRGVGYLLVPDSKLNFWQVDGLVGGTLRNDEMNDLTTGMTDRVLGYSTSTSNVHLNIYTSAEIRSDRGGFFSDARRDWYWAGYHDADRRLNGHTFPSRPRR